MAGTGGCGESYITRLTIHTTVFYEVIEHHLQKVKSFSAVPGSSLASGHSGIAFQGGVFDISIVHEVSNFHYTSMAITDKEETPPKGDQFPV